MKKTKRILLGLGILITGLFAYRVWSSNTDIWNLAGQGIYWAKDMVHVDSNYNLRLYNGNIILGDNGLIPSTDNTQTTPSTTKGGYYSIKVPFYNMGPTTAQGSVIVMSTTSTTGYCTTASITSTTSVLGISDGVYAPNTVGYMIVEGYGIVLTTGNVSNGDLLTSSATGTGQGYAGAYYGTSEGVVVAKSLQKTSGNSSVLALITLQ
jgi:hypothetical protein